VVDQKKIKQKRKGICSKAGQKRKKTGDDNKMLDPEKKKWVRQTSAEGSEVFKED